MGRFLVCCLSLFLSQCANLILDLLPPALCDNLSVDGVLNPVCVYENGAQGGYLSPYFSPSNEIKNNIIAPSSEGRVYISDRNGASFAPVDIEWNRVAYGNIDNHRLGHGNIFKVIHVNGILVASADLSHLFVSADRGQTWQFNKHVLQMKSKDEARLDLRSIAYGQGRYIAIYSRTGIIVGDEGPLGPFRHYDCKNFHFIPEDKGPCNMFFRDIVYHNKYWVIIGDAESDSNQIVAFYSPDNGKTWSQLEFPVAIMDVRFHNRRWYFLAENRSIYISDGGRPHQSRGTYTRWLSDVGAVSFDIAPGGLVRTVDRFGNMGVNAEEGSSQRLRRCVNCTSFHDNDYLHRLRYVNRIWFILGAGNHVHHSTKGLLYTKKYYGFGAFHDILAY